MTVEHGMHGADRRGVHIGIEAVEPLSDFGCAPARLLMLETHDLRFNLERQLVGMAVWPARAVVQAVQADVIVASKDLVAGLTGDAELPA